MSWDALLFVLPNPISVPEEAGSSNLISPVESVNQFVTFKLNLAAIPGRPRPEKRDSMRFGARQQPGTEEPQPPPRRGGAGRLSFCRQLLGALDMACFDRFPGRLTKPIGVADQQKQWAKVGSATRADGRTAEARLADGALGRYMVCGQRPSTKNSSSRSSALALLSASASFERIARSILSCSSIASS